MEINELKKYHKNPRKITTTQYEALEKTMQEFGDLSGVVVNVRNQEVIGGNQRTSIFQKNADKVKITKTALDKPDAQGTVAIGYIELNGSKFSYREVDWDEDKEARANIIANKAGGFWDNDILANEFDENLLKESGFSDFELGIFGDITDENDVATEWEAMPEVNEKKIEGVYKSLIVHIKDEEAFHALQSILGQSMTEKTKFIHFPYRPKEDIKSMEFIADQE